MKGFTHLSAISLVLIFTACGPGPTGTGPGDGDGDLDGILATLSVQIPGGANGDVLLDGVSVCDGSCDIEVVGGSHTIEFNCPNHLFAPQEVMVDEDGETFTVNWSMFSSKGLAPNGTYYFDDGSSVPFTTSIVNGSVTMCGFAENNCVWVNIQDFTGNPQGDWKIAYDGTITDDLCSIAYVKTADGQFDEEGTLTHESCL